MSFNRNELIPKLLSHSYGQGGAVALPSSQVRALPIGRFPAGVDDVLDRLVEAYAAWTPGTANEVEWCFLIGGPGNGKSEALRSLAGALSVQLPTRIPGEPAPRTIPTTWPIDAAPVTNGLDIVFINDASIPRSNIGGAGGASSLVLDIADAIDRLTANRTPVAVFGNINRGILVEEQAALSGGPSPTSLSGIRAAKIIEWLLQPPSSSPGQALNQVSEIETITPVESSRPYYGLFRVNMPAPAHGILVHVVFLDVLSLLEPDPGAPGHSINFSANVPSIATYTPFGGLSERGAAREQTTAGQLLARLANANNWEARNCVNPQDGTLCEAFPKCPFAQNATWLREIVLLRRFLDTLRAAEVAAARRLTYRDLLSYCSLAIIGQPEEDWLTTQHPCEWVEQKVRSVVGGGKGVTVELASHRLYNSLFSIPDSALRKQAATPPLQGDTLYRVISLHIAEKPESSPARAFDWVLNDLDPARDIESWNGLRARTIQAAESLDILSPAEQIADWSELPTAAHSEIERILDQALREEIIVEVGKPRGEIHNSARKRADLLRKWRTLSLLRQVGMALGQVMFRPALAAWLTEQQNALKTGASLELARGIEAILLPSPTTGELVLAPLRPRTYNLAGDLLSNTLIVTVPLRNLRVELIPIGDTLTAEIQFVRGREVTPIASLVVDLAVAREALLQVQNGPTSFTEIGSSAFARIERVRASLLSRDRMRNTIVYFTDEVGTRYQLAENSAGPTPLRVIPSQGTP